MPVNKNALLRYLTLDKCFRNRSRTYTFKELLQTVNEALLEMNPHSKGIEERTLRSDIAFMRSSKGYEANILIEPQGKRRVYYYSDPKFSINNSPLNSTETKKLSELVAMLSRFERNESYSWISEITSKLKDKFSLNKQVENSVIGFESNADYKGQEYITPIYDSIVNHQVLKIVYKKFFGKEIEWEIHPSYLKQYNNRWFLFGYNETEDEEPSNIPLDRIISLNPLPDVAYRPCEIDWQEYFDEIVGVTKPKGKEPLEVKLVFSKPRAPYVTTKPIHLTQKERWLDDGRLEIRVNLIPNKELQALLLSFGKDLEEILPTNLFDDF